LYDPENLVAVHTPVYVIPPATPTEQFCPFRVPDTGVVAVLVPIPTAPEIAVPLIVRFITSGEVEAGPGLTYVDVPT
jgi:hypothetical protein